LQRVDNFLDIQKLAQDLHAIRIELFLSGYYDEKAVPLCADFPPEARIDFEKVNDFS
jgi:hypothetical protein